MEKAHYASFFTLEVWAQLTILNPSLKTKTATGFVFFVVIWFMFLVSDGPVSKTEVKVRHSPIKIQVRKKHKMALKTYCQYIYDVIVLCLLNVPCRPRDDNGSCDNQQIALVCANGRVSQRDIKVISLQLKCQGSTRNE